MGGIVWEYVSTIQGVLYGGGGGKQSTVKCYMVKASNI